MHKLYSTSEDLRPQDVCVYLAVCVWRYSFFLHFFQGSCLFGQLFVTFNCLIAFNSTHFWQILPSSFDKFACAMISIIAIFYPIECFSMEIWNNVSEIFQRTFATFYHSVGSTFDECHSSIILEWADDCWGLYGFLILSHCITVLLPSLKWLFYSFNCNLFINHTKKPVVSCEWFPLV